MFNRDFSGKLVLVTGGAKNVGKVIARRFAQRGAHIILNFFHSLEASKEAAAELRDIGATVDIIRASVAQKSQVDRMFDEIDSRFGRLDILVNNAASGKLLGVDEITEEHFDRALDTNLKGAFWCSRRAAPLIARSGGGAIVNLSSLGADWVPANYLVVGTSKAALESLTRYLAVEYASLNIRVNAASSSLIDGDVADMFPDAESTKLSSIAATPLKRLAKPEDLADIVTFLASDAARWVTGQVIIADGGLSLCSEGLSPRPGLESRPTQSPPLPPLFAHTIPLGASSKAAAAVIAASRSPEREDAGDESIAIVGIGLALPGANDPEEFWNVLQTRPELFGVVPSDRWDYHSFYNADLQAPDKSYQARSAFITGFQPHARLRAEIDAGTAPEELTTQWLRHALMQALDGIALRNEDRTSFLVGYTADGSQHLEEAMVLAGARPRLKAALANSGASLEEQQRCFDGVEAALKARYWRGSSGFAKFFPHSVGLEAMRGLLPDDAEFMMVDTACSSSLYSTDLGMKALLLGQRDVVACGGAFALGPRGKVLFSKLNGLSKSGEVRPLDQASDGVLFSDGAGVVILKRLKRAIADGDQVHAIVKAFGSSSDGKGKAIYAPSSDGQNIAIRRAYNDTGVDIQAVDWVIAHATGTPAGDLAEFQSLRRMFAGDKEVQVTSNKSLIGHTGWTAGVASLIQVVLALRHGSIPGQHRFSEAPAEFKIAESNLRIPKAHVAWPAKPDAPRVAAISGFGFGGTNGHLVVSDYRPDLPIRRRSKPAKRIDEPIVIVGWSAKLPGLDNGDAVRNWLVGNGAGPARSFGVSYPLPPFERVRMPPGVLRAIDRCQLMALDAAHELRLELQNFWDKESETIGVLMGHMGPTRNAALYASRCYLDDIALAAIAAVPGEITKHALAGLREQTSSLVAQTTENSFPGMMPNVIPARVANYFDLHGLNMTIDAGHSSTLAALSAAVSYLRSGELSMAIVGGVNGNTADEIHPALNVPPAEAIVLFALTTQSRAAAAGLRVLAVVDSLCVSDVTTERPALRDRDGRCVTFLGADGALQILQTVLSGASQILTTKGDDDLRARFTISVQVPGHAAVAPETSLDETPARNAKTTIQNASAIKGASIPEFVKATDRAPDGKTLELKRYSIDLRETPWVRGADPIAFLPPHCALVTDDPAWLDELAPLPPDLTVLSLKPLPNPRPGWSHVKALAEGAIDGLIPAGVRHVRALASLQASQFAPTNTVLSTPASLDLHALTFLTLKRCYEALGEGGSFITVMLDAVTGGVPHPDEGLFSGLVKSMAIELPACRSLGLFTDATSPRLAALAAERESSAQHLLPIVVRLGERRLTLRVEHTPGELPADNLMSLGPQSVVVAVGGARGITAEVIKCVARHAHPTIYLIGSSPLNESPDLLALDDEEFARGRAKYIRERMAADPGLSMAQINRGFERLVADRSVRRNIEEMKKDCGADRVRFIRADILDASALKAAVATISAREQQIDLLVNAAGIGRSASVPVKSFDDFLAVRDLKVRGYLNLKKAFENRQPRSWCNFGSLMGLTGQSGEIDYSSANNFLNSQAVYRQNVLGADEFTIGWTLWGEIGMASNPVTRAFFEKSRLYTSTRTQEGVYHFLRDLSLSRRHAATVHLGENERNAITAIVPGFFDPLPSVGIAPATERPPRRLVAVSESPGYYLGRELERRADEVIFERIFDLEIDNYLKHHLVNGFATLPGTFVPEIAAEAALQLTPNFVVVGFEDVVFHHFLRAYDARRPSVKKIHAKVLHRDADQAVIQVRVTGDVTAPNGMVLQRDKLHFEIKAVTAAQYEQPPVWAKWPDMPSTPVADPYHFEAAPVHLTDFFVSTTNTSVTPLGKRGRYKLSVEPNHPALSRFVMPSVLLDGLARIGVLNYVADDYIPLAAPASIRRIDIYEGGNDIELARRYDPIELYATPRGYSLEGSGSSNRFVATKPGGEILLQMRDVSGVIIGYVHRITGAFVSTAEIDAILAATPGATGVAA